MVILELFFQAIAVVAAFIASWLWLQSTKIPVPKALGVARWVDENDPYAENDEKRWANAVSEKNRRAAMATAVSVSAQGAALVSSIFS